MMANKEGRAEAAREVMSAIQCPLCDNAVSSSGPVPHKPDMTQFVCPRCGTFQVSGTVERVLESEPLKGNRFILSGLTRRASENQRPLDIVSNGLDELLAQAPVPPTLPDALDEFLRMLGRYTISFEGMVRLNDNEDYPLVFARNPTQFIWLQKQVEKQGYITSRRLDLQYGLMELTVRGWDRLQQLKALGAASDQAFVAMWFDGSMDACRDNGIVPALRVCGYQPKVLSLHEHNGLIDDEIISSIRASGLLVADFTGNREGVYLEAGFAMGLGIPVIRCVRAGKDFDELHFDQEHYNVIQWSTPEDLRTKLERRILATIPGRHRFTSTASDPAPRVGQ